MTKNIYFYRARFFPSLITSVPMLVFLNKVFAVKYNDALKNIYDVLPVIAHIGLSTALIFFCIQINRLISKEIFQRFYFKDELFMPTTNHLLTNSVYYAYSVKDKIRNKIITKFNITLLDAQQEQLDEMNARKLIAASISQIRIALRDNTMLLRHNIEYGFWRNFIGGSLLAVLFSSLILIYGVRCNNQSLQTVGVICFIVYLIPILLSKLIINFYGKYYAKILFEQFLSIN